MNVRRMSTSPLAILRWKDTRAIVLPGRNLGRFCGSLYEGRGQLPEEARRTVHELVSGLSDDREKIKVLYRFLQQNTHYVGIELGIGGWQPYDASYVYNTKIWRLQGPGQLYGGFAEGGRDPGLSRPDPQRRRSAGHRYRFCL